MKQQGRETEWRERECLKGGWDERIKRGDGNGKGGEEEIGEYRVEGREGEEEVREGREGGKRGGGGGGGKASVKGRRGEGGMREMVISKSS